MTARVRINGKQAQGKSLCIRGPSQHISSQQSQTITKQFSAFATGFMCSEKLKNIEFWFVEAMAPSVGYSNVWTTWVKTPFALIHLVRSFRWALATIWLVSLHGVPDTRATKIPWLCFETSLKPKKFDLIVGQLSFDLSQRTAKVRIFLLSRFYVKSKFANLEHQNLTVRHSVEITEILSHRKNISWNQLFSNFFSKTFEFTNFFRKMCEREFS